MLTALLAFSASVLTAAPPSGLGRPASIITTPPDTTTQTTAATPTLRLRLHMSGWGGWIGGSLHSSTLIAKTEGARFGLVGLQFGHVLATEDRMAVQFTADLIPVAVLSYPPPSHPSGADFAATAPPVFGIGAVPVGLQFIYRTDRTVQPFFGGSGGLMRFPEPIPDGRGRKLNYTFDISAGVRWVVGAHRVLTLGYRFHHLSNGFRGEINPGFDANILFIGLSTM